MKVLKFGGTSVGSTESIRSVKKIVEAIEEPVIVVVSALGGITDKLLKTSDLASKGEPAYQQEFAEIVARHRAIIESVVPKAEQKKVEKQVMETLDELENIFRGVFLIKDLSPKTSDTIVSYGERLSSSIIAHVIKGAKLYDSRRFIKTVKQFNKHIVDFEETNKLIKATFESLPQVALVPGFISSSRENDEVTNLGRGGSDYTAAILAAALNASILEIWTDVDGFMTADPRVIDSACHRSPLVHRGHGALSLRRQSHLPANNLPGTPQKYPDSYTQHFQSRRAGHVYFEGSRYRPAKRHDQRHLIDQRHLSDHRTGTGYGRCHRG